MPLIGGAGGTGSWPPGLTIPHKSNEYDINWRTIEAWSRTLRFDGGGCCSNFYCFDFVNAIDSTPNTVGPFTLEGSADGIVKFYFQSQVWGSNGGTPSILDAKLTLQSKDAALYACPIGIGTDIHSTSEQIDVLGLDQLSVSFTDTLVCGMHAGSASIVVDTFAFGSAFVGGSDPTQYGLYVVVETVPCALPLADPACPPLPIPTIPD